MSRPDDLRPDALASALRTKWLGRTNRFVESCPSTNDLAASLASETPEVPPQGLVVVADTQTSGRGRLGRSWHSPPGESLYVSILLRPTVTPAFVPPLTLLAGAVVADVLVAAGAGATLKWPNDVLLSTPAGARKVAGILVEMASERERVRHVVVGIGINVNTAHLPAELDAKATSLLLATGRRVDRGAILADVLNAFEPAYEQFMREGTTAATVAWRRRGRMGQRCRVEQGGEVLDGVALDVDDDGALRLRDDAGVVHRILAGEMILS